jgi:cyclase
MAARRLGHHDHHEHPEVGQPTVGVVAENVYAYVQPDGGWFLNNAGFVRGQRTVLSVDTCATERRTRAYLQQLTAFAGDAPRTLVNTHHHGDHTNGNCFLPFSTVIGHERCREEMARSGIVRFDGLFEPVEWGDLTPAPPFVTFENRLNVYVDDLRVELIHLTGAAHTTNDVVAWIPERKVLFSGDLVLNGGTPFVAMGSVAGSLEALDMIMELDPSIIVPGHGPPGGIEIVDRCGSYLRWLQLSAEELVATGMSPLQAARELDLGEYADLLHPERLVANLHRAFAEYRGARPGEGIDLTEAFADMVTMNGGRLLTCHA